MIIVTSEKKVEVIANIISNAENAMAEIKLDDFRATHLLLHHPFSHYQGWFTYFNILHKLEHPTVSDKDVMYAKGVLDEINQWRELFFSSRQPILWNDLHSDRAEIVNRAIDVLVSSVKDIVSILSLTKDLLERGETLFDNRNDHILAIAIIGFDRYRRSNFSKAAIDFSKAFNDEETSAVYEGTVSAMEQGVDMVNLMYNDMAHGNTVRDGQCAKTILETRKIGRDSILPTLKYLNDGELLDGVREAGKFLSLLGVNCFEEKL